MIEVLRESPLFEGIFAEDIEKILNCLAARTKEYAKNEFVTCMGDKLTDIGIIISGSVQIIKEDINGNRMLMTQIIKREMFAESFLCAGIKSSPVSIIAEDKTSVLWIPLNRVLSTCQSSCGFHHKIIFNLLKIVAEKNIYLNNKINILSQKTIRGRILAYLSMQGKRTFEIPFDRNELADFLCIDRSALSRELSNMKGDGIIEYHKNKFKLL